MIPTFEQVGMMINTGMQIAEALGADDSETTGNVTISEALEDIADAVKGLQTVIHDHIIEKDVNFIDYDGTFLYSYTAEEFAELTEMPDNPRHEGLTAQGWNWTLENAQEYMAGHHKLWIGQNYVTKDGKTKLYITIPHETIKTIKLGMAVNGTVSIDWGDNSEATTLTGTSLTTYINTNAHEYPAVGDYVINIAVTEGEAAFFSNNMSKTILMPGIEDATQQSITAYARMLEKVEFGNGVSVGAGGFRGCGKVKSVTIPKTMTSFGTSAFSNMSDLQAIVLPHGLTSINSTDLGYLDELMYISLPDTLTAINSDVFRANGMRSISIPSGVTTLGSSVFSGCAHLEEIVLPNGLTEIPSTIFYNNTNLGSIIIPESVTRIREYAFDTCSDLVTVTIPAAVTKIDMGAFEYCYGLHEIHFKSETPPEIHATTFTGLQTYCKIYVPAGSLSAYTSATNYPDSNTYTYVEE